MLNMERRLSVTTEITQSGIGLVIVDHPPVNAISQDVRQGLWDAFVKLSEDTEVKAIVLRCRGRTFMAGADARELDHAPTPPHLNDLTLHIENCSKPVVAALHGQALGGGLEIALACSHRIATSSAKMGLPEVTLGFVPGAGGTQRLPRLIGVENALRMAVEGKPVSAENALKLGLIDKVAHDLENAAMALAESLVGTDVTERKLNQPIVADAKDANLFASWRARFKKRSPGLLAPQAVIDAVEAATGPDFETGLAKERALSLEQRKHPQSSALRHIFFSERSSLKGSGVDLADARNLDSIAVIGAGTMGAGIAQFFAMKGLAVTLVEISDAALEAGQERIRANLAAGVNRRVLDENSADAAISKITFTTDYSHLSNTDLVIEAAVEDMSVKQKIFALLDLHCRRDAILATNTSYLDINELAQATKQPERVVGLHFFSPAHIMKLVEIIRHNSADPAVISSLAATMRKLGKIGVIAGVCHGFIGNRIYQAYQREAGILLLETGDPRSIDNAMRNFGMAMGPFQVLDLSGIDVGYLMRQSRPQGTIHPFAFKVHDKLVEMGRKGRKTNSGFYNYAEDPPVIDDTVLDLIAHTATSSGIKRTELSDETIVARCLRAFKTEGKSILEEGIAAKASDIDVVLVNGYGFPRHKGGPMFLAD